MTVPLRNIGFEEANVVSDWFFKALSLVFVGLVGLLHIEFNMLGVWYAWRHKMPYGETSLVKLLMMLSRRSRRKHLGSLSILLMFGWMSLELVTHPLADLDLQFTTEKSLNGTMGVISALDVNASMSPPEEFADVGNSDFFEFQHSRDRRLRFKQVQNYLLDTEQMYAGAVVKKPVPGTCSFVPDLNAEGCERLEQNVGRGFFGWSFPKKLLIDVKGPEVQPLRSEEREIQDFSTDIVELLSCPIQTFDIQVKETVFEVFLDDLSKPNPEIKTVVTLNNTGNSLSEDANMFENISLDGTFQQYASTGIEQRLARITRSSSGNAAASSISQFFNSDAVVILNKVSAEEVCRLHQSCPCAGKEIMVSLDVTCSLDNEGIIRDRFEQGECTIRKGVITVSNMSSVQKGSQQEEYETRTLAIIMATLLKSPFLDDFIGISQRSYIMSRYYLGNVFENPRYARHKVVLLGDYYVAMVLFLMSAIVLMMVLLVLSIIYRRSKGIVFDYPIDTVDWIAVAGKDKDGAGSSSRITDSERGKYTFGIDHTRSNNHIGIMAQTDMHQREIVSRQNI